MDRAFTEARFFRTARRTLNSLEKTNSSDLSGLLALVRAAQRNRGSTQSGYTLPTVERIDNVCAVCGDIGRRKCRRRQNQRVAHPGRVTRTVPIYRSSRCTGRCFLNHPRNPVYTDPRKSRFPLLWIYLLLHKPENVIHQFGGNQNSVTGIQNLESHLRIRGNTTLQLETKLIQHRKTYANHDSRSRIHLRI
jgi:hypothetical protein